MLEMESDAPQTEEALSSARRTLRLSEMGSRCKKNTLPLERGEASSSGRLVLRMDTRVKCSLHTLARKRRGQIGVCCGVGGEKRVRPQRTLHRSNSSFAFAFGEWGSVKRFGVLPGSLPSAKVICLVSGRWRRIIANGRSHVGPSSLPTSSFHSCPPLPPGTLIAPITSARPRRWRMIPTSRQTQRPLSFLEIAQRFGAEQTATL